MTEKLNGYSVELPNGNIAIRTSTNDYKFAVLTRTQKPGEEFTGWYVARWSGTLDNAKKYETYLSNCPSAKSGIYKWETQIAEVKLHTKETK